MFSRIKTRHMVMLGIASVLTSFQNCSQPLDTNYADMLQQAQDSLPFAYQASVDTIAYMSCSRMPLSAIDTQGYFSFRGGAFYSGSGLTLSTDFLNQTQYYDNPTRAQVFSTSQANSGAWVQLAVRERNKYQSVLTGSGTVTPYDLGMYLMELDQNPIASDLAALTNGQWQNTFTGNSTYYENGNTQMSSSLIFMDSETTALSIRNDLNSGQAVLALTFTATGAQGDTSARGPLGTANNSAYGIGYQINFEQPYGWTLSDARVLGQISEYDLGGGTLPIPHQWQCPPDMQMLIVQPSDLFGIGGSQYPCVVHGDNQASDVTNGTITARQWQVFQALRTVLPEWEWSIDLGTAANPHRCIVPKGNAALMSCYGDRTGYDNVNYSGPSCTTFNPSTGYLGDCAHWLSMCIRN